MANTLQIRRGTESNAPTLASGEPGFSTDTYKMWVGNGTTNQRVTMHNDFDAQSILAATTADSPSALSVGEDTLVGRATGGDVAALTGSSAMSILSGTAGSSFSMNSKAITNVADPTNAQDAATKSYADAIEQGLDVKDSVVAATDGTSIDLTSSTDPNPIDGVTLSNGERVLLKDQTTASENGIYTADTATDPSTWSRAADADEDSEVTAGMFTFVEEGTANNNKGFIVTTNDTITLGTTDITFTQFSGAGQITAGTGLSKNGDTLNMDAVLSTLTNVSAGSPSDGEALVYNTTSGEWENQAITGGVSSVFGRTGDVTAQASDYDASQIDNDSTLSGTYISDALDQLVLSDLGNANIGTPSAGYLLLYDATNGEFVDSALTAGSGISKTEADGSLTISADEANIDHDSLNNFASNEHIDWTVDQSGTYTFNDNNVAKSAVTQHSYTYNDLSLEIDSTAVQNESTEPISSGWAYSHTNATTGVHGAGSNDLLHSGSTIDCGSF